MNSHTRFFSLFLLSISSSLAQTVHDHSHDHDHSLDEATLHERLQKWKTCLDARTMSPTDRAVMDKMASKMNPDLFLALQEKDRAGLIAYAKEKSNDSQTPSLCWMPGTDMDIVNAFHAVEEATNPSLNLLPQEARQASDSSRWTRTASNQGGSTTNSPQGTPVTLTWNIVQDDTPTPPLSSQSGGQVGPSNLRSRMNDIFGVTGAARNREPSEQPWFFLFEDSFANIAANTGLSYVYEENDDSATIRSSNRGFLGTRADIRIAGRGLDGNSGVLAFNFFPPFGDMVIDSLDGFFSTSNANVRARRFRNVLEHEHGHGLGLPHVCPIDNSKLMEPLINNGFLGLQFDDVYALNRLYGDFFEKHDPAVRNNDSVANAATLFVIPELEYTRPENFNLNGVSSSPFYLSIDDNSDRDFFRLPDLDAFSTITFRVTPTTDSYLEGPQDGSGRSGCSAGTIFNSGGIHNLNIALIGPDQNTILATSAETNATAPDEISNFQIPTSGDHYLRVRGGNANRAQLYTISLLISPRDLTGDEDEDGLTTLEEIFFGSDPDLNDRSGTNSSFQSTSDDGEVRYTRSSTDSNIDLRYESSPDLITWTPFTPTETITPLANGLEEVSLIAPLGTDNLFIRLRLTAP